MADKVDIRANLAEQLMGYGGMAPHLISLPVLPPDIVGNDLIDMTAAITTAGAVTDPTPVQLSGDFLTEMFGISGFMSNPATDPELLAQVKFEIIEAGRGGRIFTTKIRMAQIVGVNGYPRPMLFPRSTYVFRKGIQIQTLFTVESTYASLASEAKTFGIMLHCGKYAGK